jgi:phosphatidate phosphatase APP1
MIEWKEVLTQFAPDADARMAELRGRLYSQLGGIGPVKIIPFRGYGTPERLFLRGRVIEDHTYLAAEKNDRVWENLLEIYTHASSTPVGRACLAARFQGVEQVITADEDGFFEATIQPRRPLTGQRLWQSVELQLLDPIPEAQSRYPIKTTNEVLVPACSARCAVVSNIDSILGPTNPSHLLNLARNAFLRNPRSRLAFPGEAALYRALYAGAGGADFNPMFYLGSLTRASGVGDLYELLVQFFNLQSMPGGPVLFPPRLPEPGCSPASIYPEEQKVAALRQVLALYPHLPFILIGEGSQADPEIFTELALAFPGRIPAIYIREPERDPWRARAIREQSLLARSAGTALVVASDAVTIAHHAAQLGFIDPTALVEISEEMQKDTRPPSIMEKMLSEPPARKLTNQAIKSSLPGPVSNNKGR